MIFDGESVTRRWGDELYGGPSTSLLLRGQWQPGADYQLNDLVYWDNAIYRALRETSVPTPTPVGAIAHITAPGNLALPAGTQVNDLVLVGIVTKSSTTSAVAPTLPGSMTLWGVESAATTGAGISATIGYQTVDSGLLAIGSLPIASQGAGVEFTAFIVGLRNALPQTYVPIQNLVTTEVNTLDLSTAFALSLVGQALVGTGAVSTSASDQPNCAHGLNSYIENASFGAAIGYAINAFAPSAPQISFPTINFTDNGGSPTENQAEISIGILPTSVPSDDTTNWELFATQIRVGTARGTNGIAIGGGATVAETDQGAAIAIGSGAHANDRDNVVVGPSAQANGESSVAIGSVAYVSDYRGVAIGPYAAANRGAVAIGNTARSLNQEGVAIGDTAEAQDIAAIAIGQTTYAVAYGVAMGYQAHADGQSSVAIGPGAVAPNDFDFVLGTSSHNVAVLGTFKIGRAKQTTVGAAGAAAALPATPSAYLPITASDGTEYVLPVYAKT